jgi:hypothetical protein
MLEKMIMYCSCIVWGDRLLKYVVCIGEDKSYMESMTDHW